MGATAIIAIENKEETYSTLNEGKFIWNIYGVYIRVPLVSLHKVWRSIAKKVEIDADISGNIMAFLWKQRCFT